MGTNYYLLYDNCPHCGRPQQKMHIGKLSCGWVFCFQKQQGFSNLKEVKERLKHGTIINEYEETLSYKDFLNVLKADSKHTKHDYEYAEQIDGYDWVSGDFS